MMEDSSLSLPTPFPAIHLLVSHGGANREATLVDPCVLYLLKQKREEGMFLSSSLGDLLAPRMGVKVLWPGTNRTEIVQASSIRILNGFNWQPQRQQHQQNHHYQQRISVAPPSSISEDCTMDRKRLIWTLRDSSSLATEVIRQQFMSQSMQGQFLDHSNGNVNNCSNNNGIINDDDVWNTESFNKRRKLGHYSAWLQERCKSISSEPSQSPLASMTAFANSSNPFLNNFNNIGDIHSLQQQQQQRQQQQHQHHNQQQQQQQQEQLKHLELAKSSMMANIDNNNNRNNNRNNNNNNPSNFGEENEFLQRLLSTKRASTQTGIASRTIQQKKVESPPNNSKAETAANEKEWKFMYGRLLKHMEERGLEKVPTRIHMDPELRNWVAQQRLHFKKRNLNTERQCLLRSIGFHRDKFTLKWDAKFERLQQFKKEHGHTNVPFHYAKDRQLGTWVSKQRVRIRQGTISPEEKMRLEAIGFVPNRFNARWEEMFRRLVAYKKLYGDSNVPRVYEKDSQLAQWVLNQKDAFREGKMKPERQVKLEAIGFSWSTFYEGDLEWERNFQKLVAHQSTHGHIRFFNDQKLSRWVALQQSLNSMGTLNEQRRKLLCSIGAIPSNGKRDTSARAAALQKQEHHQEFAPSSVIPPTGLRQSFSEWRNSNGNTVSNFL